MPYIITELTEHTYNSTVIALNTNNKHIDIDRH